jgi:hypothetical protein
LVSGVAQFVVSRLRMSLLLGGLGSVAMGSGIAGLALQRHGCHGGSSRVQLFPILVSVSIGLAIVDLGWKKKASIVLVSAAIPVTQIKDSQPIKSSGFAVPAL